MLEDPIAFASGSNHRARRLVLRDHVVFEQHHVGVEVARKFSEQRREQRIVALTLDVCRARLLDQLTAQQARPLPERWNDVEFEERIPAFDFLSTDRPIPDVDLVDLQQIRVGPASRMTRVIPDLAVHFLQEQRA